MQTLLKSLLAVLTLGVVLTSVPAAENDDLPYAGVKMAGISWDVRALEDNADNFSLVKRTASKTSVEWLVQVNSETEVERAKFWAISPHYQAVFLDEDGVAVTSVDLWYSNTDLRVGERVRVGLKLPGAEVIGRTKSIVLKLR